MSSFASFKTLTRIALLAAAAGACIGASAQTEAARLHRVEVNGQTLMAPERYDVRASCAALDSELALPLGTVLMRERVGDEVRVSFVLDQGRISDVSARGSSRVYETAVKRAVMKMHCVDAKAASSPQVFAFRIGFIDPYAAAGRDEAQTASADPAYRVAVVSR